ncbi:MAG: 3'-5' exonuclease [Gemmatimonadota bacterium]|jgi:DNA polymerase-3 subunit epsilon
MDDRVRDLLSQLSPTLEVDAGKRSEAGIRISLPPRKGGSTPYPLGCAEARRARFLAERELRPYGAGWADGGGSPDDGLRSLEYVVVDVETTGGSARRGHRITEFAAVRMRGDGRWLGEYSTLVNPERHIPGFVSRLTRITDAMTARAPLFADVSDRIREILSGAVFVAHNASFDWRFVSTELDWAVHEPLRGRVLCTVRLARKVVPEVRRRSLDSLCHYFGFENEARHRAFGDARVTARILARLLDRLDDMQIERWHQLDALLARRAPRRKRRASPEPVREW